VGFFGVGFGGGGVGFFGVGGTGFGVQCTISFAGGSCPASSSSLLVIFTGAPVLVGGHAKVNVDFVYWLLPSLYTLSEWFPIPPLKVHDVIVADP
jgi:hypothetical protein